MWTITYKHILKVFIELVVDVSSVIFFVKRFTSAFLFRACGDYSQLMTSEFNITDVLIAAARQPHWNPLLHPYKNTPTRAVDSQLSIAGQLADRVPLLTYNAFNVVGTF